MIEESLCVGKLYFQMQVGSKGSKGSEGSEGGGIALRAMSIIVGYGMNVPLRVILVSEESQYMGHLRQSP